MPGLLRGVARTAVVAGTATAVSNRVSRRQQSRWAQQDPQPGQYDEAPPQAPPAAPAADPIAQLKELGELRDKGVLTEEEFAAQKAKLLAS
jgi:Short C-terminal domain